MKRDVIAVVSIVIFLSVLLSGCEQINPQVPTDSNKFLGSWQNTTAYPGIIHFYETGFCLYGDDSGTWEIHNNKLLIVLEKQGISHSYNYWFSDNDQALHLTKALGYSIVYSKQ